MSKHGCGGRHATYHDPGCQFNVAKSRSARKGASREPYLLCNDDRNHNPEMVCTFGHLDATDQTKDTSDAGNEASKEYCQYSKLLGERQVQGPYR